MFERLAVPPWLPRVAQTVPFRLAIVVVCLAIHLSAIVILKPCHAQHWIGRI